MNLELLQMLNKGIIYLEDDCETIDDEEDE